MTRGKAEQSLKHCQLPEGTEHMTFDNFDTGENTTLRAAKEAAWELANEAGDVKWLTLLGEVDRGKTHLAVAVCRHWLDQGKMARYAFVPLLLKELRDGYQGEEENSYRQRFDNLCKIPLLVMDDLGTERATDWGVEQLQTIIHYRGIYKLPLVVTTNRPLDRLFEGEEYQVVGMRIGSRLQREGWCRVVVMDAQEHRLGGN